MSTDRDRAAVYAAELAAFDGTDLESVVGLDVIAAAVRRVVTGEWWTGPTVSVRPARSDAHSSSTRCGPSGDPAVISIAQSQATMATAAHELAHALVGPAAGHDASFRTAYLDVVAVITNVSSVLRRGDVHIEQLAEAFARAGLGVGSRRWPAPPASISGPIAL